MACGQGMPVPVARACCGQGTPAQNLQMLVPLHVKMRCCAWIHPDQCPRKGRCCTWVLLTSVLVRDIAAHGFS